MQDQASTASSSTKPGRGRRKVSQSDLDAKAAKFIDERLPGKQFYLFHVFFHLHSFVFI